jgi:hypothetical protein
MRNAILAAIIALSMVLASAALATPQQLSRSTEIWTEVYGWNADHRLGSRAVLLWQGFLSAKPETGDLMSVAGKWGQRSEQAEVAGICWAGLSRENVDLLVFLAPLSELDRDAPLASQP